MRWAPLLLLLTASGCGGPGADIEAPVARDSAGVRIVEYSRVPSLPATTLPEIPTLQLGVVEGDTAQEFGYVAGATRLSDGSIIVADGSASQVRAFGPDGALLWIAGREGEGPGEYRNIGWVREHGDSIAVFDRSLRRLTILSAEGEMVRVVSPDLTPDGLRPSVISVLPDGSMIVTAQTQLTPNVPAGINRPPISISRYAAAGDHQRTLTSISGPEWTMTAVEGRRLLAPRVFGADGTVSAASGVVAAAETERFEIRWMAVDGTLRTILRVLDSPPAVTGADVQEYRDYRLEREPDPTRHPRIEREVAQIPFPERHPALRRIYLDRTSRLWVEEYGLPWERHPSFLVFDEAGRFKLRVGFPPGHLLMESGAGYILVRYTDEMGVQYVRLHQVDLG